VLGVIAIEEDEPTAGSFRLVHCPVAWPLSNRIRV
jgi:hypothetical protein